MRFGFHISIAGGKDKIVKRAKELSCETVQFFSRNPHRWGCSDLKKEEIENFKKGLKNAGISPIFIHLPYLVNLASCNKIVYEKSLEVLIQDLRKAFILGASFLVLHIGSRGELFEEEAFEKIAKGINKVFKLVNQLRTTESRVHKGMDGCTGKVRGVPPRNYAPERVVQGLLLENTSGQGKQIGYNFFQIREIIKRVEYQNRIGVCFDTAHAFEAGYDLSTEKGLGATLKELEKYIGLEKLYLIHLNDSKTPLGSKVDRHWHIGQGYIGLEGFRNIINHPQLIHLPAIMETPRKNKEDDLRNMMIARRLQREL